MMVVCSNLSSSYPVCCIPLYNFTLINIVTCPLHGDTWAIFLSLLLKTKPSEYVCIYPGIMSKDYQQVQRLCVLSHRLKDYILKVQKTPVTMLVGMRIIANFQKGHLSKVKQNMNVTYSFIQVFCHQKLPLRVGGSCFMDITSQITAAQDRVKNTEAKSNVKNIYSSSEVHGG